MNGSVASDLFLQNSDLYLDPELAARFDELENQSHHQIVSDIVDQVAMSQTPDRRPLHIAELGAGSHIDRYRRLFEALLHEPQGRVDWVEGAEPMLELARGRLNMQDLTQRRQVAELIHSDIFDYLGGLDDDSLDLAIMKNTFGYVKDLRLFFELLFPKLKPGGKLIATAKLNPSLSGKSEVGRFYINGNQSPVAPGQVVQLKNNDRFTVEFFSEPGNLNAKPLAKTTKVFHSVSSIRSAGEHSGFHVEHGDWTAFTNDTEGVEMARDMIVLTKEMK